MGHKPQTQPPNQKRPREVNEPRNCSSHRTEKKRSGAVTQGFSSCSFLLRHAAMAQKGWAHCSSKPKRCCIRPQLAAVAPLYRFCRTKCWSLQGSRQGPPLTHESWMRRVGASRLMMRRCVWASDGPTFHTHLLHQTNNRSSSLLLLAACLLHASCLLACLLAC